MALVTALLAGFLLLTYGTTTLFMADTETAIASADRAGREALYAADAGAQAVIAEVASTGTWDPPLAVRTSSILFDGTLVATVQASESVNLTTRTSVLQALTDAEPSGGDRSEWHLFAWGPASMLLSSSATIGPFYLAVWLADDSGDNDGDPSFDTNGIVIVHAESYGPRGLMRVVECVVSRGPTTGSRPVLLSWRELRPI